MLRGARAWLSSPGGVMSWSRLVPGLRRRLNRPPLTDLTKVSRLGVLRPDGMGDIVLTTGMLRELRQQLPATRITFICQSQWAQWMRTCPWIDDVVSVEVTSPSERFREARQLLELSRFMKRVWPLDLEVVVQPGTFRSYRSSRALAWFSGAPVRLCWEDPAAGVDTGGQLHTHSLPYPNSWHQTDKCFRLLEVMGVEARTGHLATWWTSDDELLGEETARQTRKGRQYLIALGLAASLPSKRWPRERYVEVIRRVVDSHDASFLALGGPDVADTCRWMATQVPNAVTYAGERLPLGAIWASIARCDLYLGNDTGFMHMAAAAHIPVVAVVGIPEGAGGGPDDLLPTGPYDTVSRVVRPPAGAADRNEKNAALVSVDAVAKATLELLELLDNQ